MKVDYLEIVLTGYFNNSNYLEKYFLREFRKAEKEYFEPEEFFSGCLKVIEVFEANLQKQVHERKKELYLLKDISKDKKAVEYCERELKNERPNGIGNLSFTVHLNSLTKGRFTRNMPYIDVLHIKNNIQKAWDKISDNVIEGEAKQIEPLDIEKASHKILVLHELGVLDHLKKTYPVPFQDTNTSLSKLLAPLLGEKPETIRGALKNLNQSKPKGIINTASVRKVKAELSKLGIETQTLPDL